MGEINTEKQVNRLWTGLNWQDMVL